MVGLVCGALNGFLITVVGLPSLAVTVGSLWVLIVNASVRNETVLGHIASTGLGVMAFQMYFFAAFSFILIVCVFGLPAPQTFPVSGS